MGLFKVRIKKKKTVKNIPCGESMVEWWMFFFCRGALCKSRSFKMTIKDGNGESAIYC